VTELPFLVPPRITRGPHALALEVGASSEVFPDHDQHVALRLYPCDAKGDRVKHAPVAAESLRVRATEAAIDAELIRLSEPVFSAMDRDAARRRKALGYDR